MHARTFPRAGFDSNGTLGQHEPAERRADGNTLVADSRGFQVLDYVEPWAGFVLSPWVRGTALLTVVGVVVVSAALVVDLALLVSNRPRY